MKNEAIIEYITNNGVDKKSEMVLAMLVSDFREAKVKKLSERKVKSFFREEIAKLGWQGFDYSDLGIYCKSVQGVEVVDYLFSELNLDLDSKTEKTVPKTYRVSPEAYSV